jgi:hypothetical protein
VVLINIAVDTTVFAIDRLAEHVVPLQGAPVRSAVVDWIRLVPLLKVFDSALLTVAIKAILGAAEVLAPHLVTVFFETPVLLWLT